MPIKTWIANTASTWTTAASWSGGTVPVTGDDIVFNTTGGLGAGNCTITGIAGTPNFNSFTTTGYSGVLFWSATLTIVGNITLSSGVIDPSSTGTMLIRANSTITSNGAVINVIFNINPVSTPITVQIADTCILSKGIAVYGTPLLPITLQSTVPGTQRVFTVQNNVGVQKDVDYMNVSDMDNSAGVTVWSYAGTISNSPNWGNMGTQPPGISRISIT